MSEPAICGEDCHPGTDSCNNFCRRYPLAYVPAQPLQRDEARIKHMVSRFLGWRLPEDFSPDAGISFKAEFNENTPWPMKHQPVGTNLFSAAQAEAMIRYILEGLPKG